MTTIYLISSNNSTIKGQFIGSTQNIKQRIEQHKSSTNLSNDLYHHQPLYTHIRSNGGFVGWRFDTLEIIKQTDIISIMGYEMKWIKMLRPSLNIIHTDNYEDYGGRLTYDEAINPIEEEVIEEIKMSPIVKWFYEEYEHIKTLLPSDGFTMNELLKIFNAYLSSNNIKYELTTQCMAKGIITSLISAKSKPPGKPTIYKFDDLKVETYFADTYDL